MRAKIANLDEAINFILNTSTEVERKEIIDKLILKNKSLVQMHLFGVVEDHTLLPPSNQYELVLYTLIFPPTELSGNYWSQIYKTMKWSTRLGELEKAISQVLVSRKFVDFTNRFGHKGQYVVYTPILPKEKYIDLYNQLKNKIDGTSKPVNSK